MRALYWYDVRLLIRRVINQYDKRTNKTAFKQLKAYIEPVHYTEYG
jgi:hypothetical protein